MTYKFFKIKRNRPYCYGLSLLFYSVYSDENYKHLNYTKIYIKNNIKFYFFTIYLKWKYKAIKLSNYVNLNEKMVGLLKIHQDTAKTIYQ